MIKFKQFLNEGTYSMPSLSFKSFLNEAKNLHLEHAEDLLFDLGVEGARKAIFFLRDVRDMLTMGSAPSKTVASVKWDGAPSLFAGVNPENGKTFVAKKGIFNKNPKLYYTAADVDADTRGDLSTKLKIALAEVQKLGIKSGVYQGDIMFTKDDLFTQTIEGKKYVCFHPNTIVYAVPHDSGLAKQIRAANIGIVWHTTYTGKTIESLDAQFGKPIVHQFKKVSSSWMVDATYSDATGVAMFSPQERAAFDEQLSRIGRLFRSIPAQVLNAIHKDPDLLGLVKIYNNSKIRAGIRTSDNVTMHVDGLYQFIVDRYGKEEADKKTAVGKQKVADKRKKVLNFFFAHPRTEIAKLFELSFAIADAKEMLINQLNRASGISTFLKTKNGFRVTAPEGYVALNASGAVKLVDRLEFSMANFSPEILRGWER